MILGRGQLRLMEKASKLNEPEVGLHGFPRLCRPNLTVFQRLCTNESTRLVINSHMYEPDCPSSQKYEQERCTALAFEPNPLTVDGELNCR